MAIEIQPIYPLQGSNNVPQNTTFTVDIVSTAEEVIDFPNSTFVLFKFEPLGTEDYPGGTDIYNSGLETDVLTDLTTAPVDTRGYYYAFDGIDGFKSNALPDSTTTVISAGKHIRFNIVLDKLLQYGMTMRMEVNASSLLPPVTENQQFAFRIIDRPFYSPALNDSLSLFEDSLINGDFTSFSETKKLRDYLLPLFHSNETIAARRFLQILLTDRLRPANLVTETQQILAGYKTKDYKNPYLPARYFDVATSLAAIGFGLIESAAKEIDSIKAIDRSLIEPILEILPAASANKVYLVEAAVGLVGIVTKLIASL